MKKTTFWNSQPSNRWDTPNRIPRRNFSAMRNSLSRENAGLNTSPRKKISQNNSNRFIAFITSGAFLWRLFGGFLILTIFGFFLIYGIFLQGLPDISEVKNPKNFQESTILYDADGNEIFRYSENGKRTYIGYENISQSIKDAIVATEDPTFFTNPGVDIFGIARAIVSSGGNKNEIKGTSTLSQQLIKNTLLSNERTFKRKIREAYLAYKLNNTYTKEEILEMYLNAIEFGHGANGIEQASLTFFWKHAKDVGPLGATILASLPKGPTAYSPYSRRGALMGKIEVYPTDNSNSRLTLDIEAANSAEHRELYTTFKNYLKNLTFTAKWGSNVEICGIKKEYIGDKNFGANASGCTTITYDDLLNFIGTIQITSSGEVLEYTIGRKDYVAVQMFEKEKINGETFGKIIYDGLEFQFNTPKNEIKYPYFVMYVQEQLEQKYGEDINVKTGLKVYTTIRPQLQQKAEEIIREQAESNKKQYNASSASLVAMDNITGEIVAMVGGPSYEKDQNNMTTAYRQPGSSFKPFLYGLAISKHPIGPESPIADVQTKFGSYAPNNYDEGFKGIMSVGAALAYSRNITAVKMYFLAGKDPEIINFMKTLGVHIKPHPKGDYGAPMALGTAEVRAIDMMQAYSVFANNGIKREAYAIKKIEDMQGWVIEEKMSNDGQQVFSAAASHIVNIILSENKYRPESTMWRNNLTIKGKTAAAKTGTSNLKTRTGIAPRDTWTIGYSPNITTIVWAGNVDGSVLSGKCDGINCAAPAWNKFMTYALKDYPNAEFKAPSDLLTFYTAKLSGLLSKNGVANIMAVKLAENDSGNKETKIDSLCGGPVTDKTPEDAIISIYTPTSKPIIDRFDPEWLKGFYRAANINASEGIKTSNNPCERPDGGGNVNISAKITGVGKNILEVSWSGDRMVEKLRILVNGKTIKESNYDDPAKSGSDRVSTNGIPENATVVVEIIDVYGHKYSKSWVPGGTHNQTEATETPTLPTLPALPSLEEEANKNNPPIITVSNPSRGSISVYKWDTFNLRFDVKSPTTKRTVSVSVNGTPISTATSGDNFVIPVSTANLPAGHHTVVITATSGNNKSDSRSITLIVM